MGFGELVDEVQVRDVCFVLNTTLKLFAAGIMCSLNLA